MKDRKKKKKLLTCRSRAYYVSTVHKLWSDKISNQTRYQVIQGIKGKLIGGTVPPNNTLFRRTVLPNNTLFGRAFLPNSTLFGGTLYSDTISYCMKRV